MRWRQKNEAQADVNLTPLIDMVFTLLLFFVVSASFAKESGVDVNRPEAVTAESRNPSVIISVDAGNIIWVDNHTIDLRSVKSWMIRFLVESPEGAVVIAADTMARSGMLIQVLDACREAGAKNVSVATKVPS